MKFSRPEELGTKLAEQARGLRDKFTSIYEPKPLSQLVLALTVAGGLSSLRGECSALGASVRVEIHQSDEKSGSPTGFLWRALVAAGGASGAVTPG